MLFLVATLGPGDGQVAGIPVGDRNGQALLAGHVVEEDLSGADGDVDGGDPLAGATRAVEDNSGARRTAAGVERDGVEPTRTLLYHGRADGAQVGVLPSEGHPRRGRCRGGRA